jgi:predicted HNH restriction endonuclease
MLHFNSDTGRPTIAFLSDVPRQHIAVFTQSNDPSQSPATHDPYSATLIEGQLVHVTLTVQERNPIARRRCIEHYGTSCIVCGFSFGRVYGEPFAGYIHVHHLTPLSTRATEHEIDPIEDLRPVCPNCHTVIHTRQPPLTISEIKDILAAAKSHGK